MEANPKGSGVCGEILGYCSFLLLFWGREGVDFHGFFCFVSEQSPVPEGSTRRQRAVRAHSPQQLHCLLPCHCSATCLYLLLPFSLCGSPREGDFPTDLLDNSCTLPQPPQSLWILFLALVLLLRSPTAASRAGTCWGELLLIYHPSALCFDLLSFFG